MPWVRARILGGDPLIPIEQENCEETRQLSCASGPFSRTNSFWVGQSSFSPRDGVSVNPNPLAIPPYPHAMVAGPVSRSGAGPKK